MTGQHGRTCLEVCGESRDRREPMASEPRARNPKRIGSRGGNGPGVVNPTSDNRDYVGAAHTAEGPKRVSSPAPVTPPQGDAG